MPNPKVLCFPPVIYSLDQMVVILHYTLKMTVRPDVTCYFIYSPRLECKFDRKNYSRTTGLPSSTFSLTSRILEFEIRENEDI